MIKPTGNHKILKAIYKYLLFFCMVAFPVTCTTGLFVATLQTTLGITFTEEQVSVAAKSTFFNVVLLSLIFASIDTFRRKMTVERTAKHIETAAERIVQGDFGARVEAAGLFTDEHFNGIIDSFNQMAEELSGVETLRTDFISNVSHELKTPLAVMQNYASLLQTPDLPEEKRMEYARAIEDGSKRLSDMMTNILKLNRLENQQIYPKAEKFNLGEHLAECLLAYESVWEAKNIELETDIAEDVYVHADRELLSLVWGNLFSNAFKFTPDGGIVTVSLGVTPHHAIVKVQDTGCGISPENGPQIFEKFYQGDTSHATQGNGLGLALVKRVVDILRAEIGVESALGKGSTFTVRIRRTSDGNMEKTA